MMKEALEKQSLKHDLKPETNNSIIAVAIASSFGMRESGFHTVTATVSPGSLMEFLRSQVLSLGPEESCASVTEAVCSIHATSTYISQDSSSLRTEGGKP